MNTEKTGLEYKAFHALGITIVYISVAENFPGYLNKQIGGCSL